MKAKISLDRAKLQGFLLAHVEKIVVGAVLIVFVALIYRALGVESYQKTPGDLATATSNARSHIDRIIAPIELTRIIDADPALVVRPYDKTANRSSEQVTPEVHPQVFPPLKRSLSAAVRRPKPEFFALEGLRAAAANGAFAFRLTPQEREARDRDKAAQLAGGGNRPRTGRPRLSPDHGRGGGNEEEFDNDLLDGNDREVALVAMQDEQLQRELPLVNPPDNSKATGFRWVVLTGLVPLREQAAEYRAKFEETRFGYDSAGRDVPTYAHFYVERAEVVPGQTAEKHNWQPVDLRNSVNLERRWTEDFPNDCDPFFQDYVLTRPLPPLLARNWGEGVVHLPEIAMLDPKNRRFGSDERERDPDDDREDFGPDGQNLLNDGEDLLGSGLGRGDEGERDYRRSPQNSGGHGGRPMPGKREDDPSRGQTAEYKLFRFFDYSVTAGKSYVYRVRTRMLNPNYGLPSHTLESSELSQEKYGLTPWAELAETVTVPGDNYLVVGMATPPRGANGPKSSVIIENFDLAQGLKASGEFTVYRGTIANYSLRSVQVVDPITRVIDNKKLSFRTNSVVLDIMGGEILGPKTRDSAPGMLLLLDPAGNLVVREELADAETYGAAKGEMDRISSATKPPKRGPNSDEDRRASEDKVPRRQRNRNNR